MAEHQRVVDLLQHNLPQMLLAHKPKMKSASPKAGGAEGGGDLDDKTVTLILCGAIKISDLGHAFAPFDVHRRWSLQLEEELYRQGDEEIRRALQVSYLMDRSKPGVTQSQQGFFDYVVRPLTLAWVQSFPLSQPLLEELEANAVRWGDAKGE